MPIDLRRAGARTAAAVLAAAAILLIFGGSSSGASWHGLRSVRVSVQTPSLPPPGGKPRTKVFTTATALTGVTHQLNAHHIHQVRDTSSKNNGCAGGTEVAITLTPRGAKAEHLHAYRCATTTTGDIGGDLLGFLNAIGLQI
jgi:hypothetical protein